MQAECSYTDTELLGWLADIIRAAPRARFTLESEQVHVVFSKRRGRHTWDVESNTAPIGTGDTPRAAIVAARRRHENPDRASHE